MSQERSTTSPTRALAYGSENPHPLSQMKTELVWEGKYDEHGNRRPVKLPTTPLPLQRIETIDVPRDVRKAEANQQGLLFNETAFRQQHHRDDFRNRLIWGDNKLVMASLLQEFRGKIDLIYIDPPFDVGADFTMKIQIGDDSDEVLSEPTPLELGILCVSLVKIEEKYSLDVQMCGSRGFECLGKLHSPWIVVPEWASRFLVSSLDSHSLE